MKTFFNRIYRPLGCAFVIMWLACTHNPFDSTEISIPRRTIFGTVQLSDRGQPDGVFVWLEGFDLGTFTDANGYFAITLPITNHQAGSELTGSFQIFFFLANYRIATATIVLRRGELDFQHSDFQENGALRDPIYLRKYLDIQTTVAPAEVYQERDTNLSVELILQALEDTVFVQYPDKAQGPLAVVIVKSSQDNSSFVWEINDRATIAATVTDTITIIPKAWSAALSLRAGRLERGQYQIVPYFLIHPAVAPPGAMLARLGQNIMRPGVDFLKLPIKRNGGNFEVKGAD
ncbi:MAG: carboxypeptidase-like regulatory domain-containing protein [candidate division KSB1 bacterium]|nr:carboxypeptidase-like regulatory domain-containing protein [candidate division KSB1 bacterium]